ncbi:hypothetical protein EJ04DRAFT_574445 [Polyplosphaeria fusca]|uniref:Uncharacterized protein n=1 Tax=Polyplosphaeria fusca TaxID=682080 RepID=A0A9P4R6Q6_9PLEO|nr:hypothetical protein EJ04DRAFT_574445 [Polyplosphaeria fusca]
MAEPGAAVANKFLSKNRWRAKFLNKDEDTHAKEAKEQKQKANLDEDVNAFLKPSVDKAHAHKEAAAAAFLGGANKPRIDVAKAQRWPGSHDVGKSPGIGGLKTGKTRKKGLTVSFVRTMPVVIGEGGDECEEPSIEVHMRKKSNSLTDVDKLRNQSPMDDLHLGQRSPSFNSQDSVNLEAQRRGIVTRSHTSPGELSPPLQQRMQMGSINAHASPPPEPPQRLGPMGLGDRPKALQRTATGFDVQEDDARRPSVDSSFSFDSDNASVVHEKPKAPSLAPTAEEDESDFVPKPLQRSQTGWSEHMADSDEESVPTVPRLPELKEFHDDDSPLDASIEKYFLKSEPDDSNSFSARVIHKMRADEGRALHDAARQATAGSKRDSSSSTSSFQPSAQLNPFEVGTPPGSYSSPLAGKTPPRIPSREPPPPRDPPISPGLPFEDPHRSRARGPSPGRPHLPPGSFPLDTDARPASSGSSQYTIPSAASRSRGSPLGPQDGFSTTANSSLQETPASIEKGMFSSTRQTSIQTQNSIQATPPLYEKSEYMTNIPESAPQPPPHMQSPTLQPVQAISQEKQDMGMQVAPQHKQDPGMQVAANFRQDPGLQLAPNNKQDPGMQLAPNNKQDPGMQVVPSFKQDPGLHPVQDLGRSDTRAQGEAAYCDFSERVQHMQGIFRLTAELNGQLYDHSPMQWLRVAIWWFLKGRAAAEASIRSRPKDSDPQPERLTQYHVDLAKTWWILTQVLPYHPWLRKFGDQRMETQAQLARDSGDLPMAEIYDVNDTARFHLKMLLGSMKRHQVMPPTQALIQGQDQRIWEEYPQFTPDVQSILSGHPKALMANGAGTIDVNPAIAIPLGDTKSDFCYFRMFVTISLSTDDPNTDRVPLPAVVSVLRPRDGLMVKLSICSMTNLVNFTVGPNPEAGPTWRDIQWKSKSRGFSVSLKHGYTMNADLNENDFRSLWAMVDHTNRVEAQLYPRGDERLALKVHLRDFTYTDPTHPAAFPAGRVRGCRLSIFEKSDRSSEGTGKRRLHRGYRIVVVTNAKNRTLSCVAHEMGTRQGPTNFEYATDSDGAPALILKFKEEAPNKKEKICTMFLVFTDSKERNALFGTFTSMNQGPDENVFAQVPLKALSIESADAAEGFSQSGHDVLKKLQWQTVKVMNQDPVAAGLETAPTVMSESLRLICRHSSGVISDRMNLGPGDLLVRLPVDGAAELTLLRNPQQDMAVAIDSSRSEKDVPDALADLLQTLTTASTIRRLTFNTFADLHAFQLAVTGFRVLFDGIATTFAISRRRMVVPIYKQWTANTLRLQVVAQDNVIQLLAFFQDFSHADAMNFQLKSMDVFEKIEKSSKPGLRLVDAKFALPVEERRGEGKMQKDEGRLTGWSGMKRKFVCLDQIEYPGEHDDIVITFDSMETRDRFAEALPAATMQRKFTVMRKI